MTEPTLWGIHAGQTGDADELFLTKSVVAIGWALVGDLSRLASDREAFKAAVAVAYPEMKPAGVPNSAGQLFRFVHEMRPNDIIVYPSKLDRHVHVGKVTGQYRFDPSLGPGDPKKDKGYPNVRPVEWIKDVPRTALSQGALYEIGSALTLFQVRNYADEYRVILSIKTPETVVEDDAAGYSPDDLVQTTRDFVLKRLAQDLKGHPLATFVGHLLTTLGYHVRVAPPGPDGGIDILAHKDELGVEPPLVKVQVKSSPGSVGLPEVSALQGNVGSDAFGLLVTLGSFTPAARTFAQSKQNMRLIDGQELVDLILAHYEELSPGYKAVVPLRQIRVPLSPTDADT